MKEEVLRKIGLTEGEIRVYKALIKSGNSSTGPIMNESGISSSKVYLILDKLIKKGLINFSLENNIKRFHVSNPINIIEYITKQEDSIKKIKKEAQSLVNEISKTIATKEKEYAKIYRGEKSLRTAFQNILDNSNGKFKFIGAPLFELNKLELFFKNLQAKREDKKITTEGIVNISTKKEYSKIFKDNKDIKIKYINLDFPHAVAIGNDRIIISLWEPTVIGFEIESVRIAKRYQEFFSKLWNTQYTFS